MSPDIASLVRAAGSAEMLPLIFLRPGVVLTSPERAVVSINSWKTSMSYPTSKIGSSPLNKTPEPWNVSILGNIEFEAFDRYRGRGSKYRNDMSFVLEQNYAYYNVLRDPDCDLRIKRFIGLVLSSAGSG